MTKVRLFYGTNSLKEDIKELITSEEIVKQLSVCIPNDKDGLVYQYELTLDNLKILDLTSLDVLVWLAEVLKNKKVLDSKRYQMLASKFIEQYGIDTSSYDIIIGYRLDASHLYLVKEFIQDNLDLNLFKDILVTFEKNYYLKSQKVLNNLKKIDEEITVNYQKYNTKYNTSDCKLREKIMNLVNSEANSVTKVFSTLVKE